MCYANFTQHSGCGHIGESCTQPLTLCDDAIQRLYSLRGPNSPLISPPATQFFAPPNRSASKRRFFSLSGTLSRSSSTVSRQSERPSLRSANPSFTPTTTVPVDIDYKGLPEHQVNAVKCKVPVRRSQVASEMDVCPECKKSLNDMRSMLERYDKTGSIRGTTAFEQFLRFGDDRNYTAAGDVTIPLRDSITGEHGAMQAIVLGHASDSPALPQRSGTWGREADAETLSDHHVNLRHATGPRRAMIVGRTIDGHPSEVGSLIEGGTNGLGYWKGDDVSSLATSRVFAGI
ncbi:hypothetical protein BU23DRAFT_549264 [Bimuria novae-zelandiae CBS 107.79]|uniref:Uncharacterized protein n=1 Tax=Bimuria novae-zelandiae CBS 107.79 TaxID=1447943 RepID=A0A6A5VR27_9PLEO|nr:hypothetical protein BU23DRAFT_549264 [Bimuria novae-zelandiae CBS 107.79]